MLVKPKHVEHQDSRPSSPEDPLLLARPLESLVFVLPMILAYEIGNGLAVQGDPAQTTEGVAASVLLNRLFDLFGTTTLWMPGLAVVSVLLATQMVSRRPWTIRWGDVGWMGVESVLWALPLIFLDRWVRLAAVQLSGYTARDVTLCLGAAVYEEFVFRLLMICALVMIGVDLFRGRRRVVLPVALIVSALLFAAHHHPPIGLEPFAFRPFFFRTLAGAYLASIFIVRGYAPAVGCHAAYNVLAMM